MGNYSLKDDLIALVILIVVFLMGFGLGYISPHPTKTNSGKSSIIASSSVTIPSSSISVEYKPSRMSEKTGEKLEPRVSIPTATHTASMTIVGDFFTANILYEGSTSVKDNTYEFNDKLSETHIETGQVIKPMTWLDYIVMYGGWIFFGLKMLIH